MWKCGNYRTFWIYIKNTCAILLNLYVELLNKMFETKVLSYLNRGNIEPFQFIKKKGNNTDQSNYRPLTLIICLGLSLMKDWLSMQNSWAYFRKRSLVFLKIIQMLITSYFLLYSLIKLYNKTKIYYVFIDFEKA